jgi:hypothetical protein
MSARLHSIILAITSVATVAVGIASASTFGVFSEPVATKTDRLPMLFDPTADYVTIETRKDGVSLLRRVPIGLN